MKKNFNILIEKDKEGFYVSEVIGLNGCHTQAKSLDELMKRTKEAIELYLECSNLEDSSIKNEFIGVSKLTI